MEMIICENESFFQQYQNQFSQRLLEKGASRIFRDPAGLTLSAKR